MLRRPSTGSLAASLAHSGSQGSLRGTGLDGKVSRLEQRTGELTGFVKGFTEDIRRQSRRLDGLEAKILEAQHRAESAFLGRLNEVLKKFEVQSEERLEAALQTARADAEARVRSLQIALPANLDTRLRRLESASANSTASALEGLPAAAQELLDRLDTQLQLQSKQLAEVQERLNETLVASRPTACKARSAGADPRVDGLVKKLEELGSDLSVMSAAQASDGARFEHQALQIQETSDMLQAQKQTLDLLEQQRQNWELQIEKRLHAVPCNADSMQSAPGPAQADPSLFQI